MTQEVSVSLKITSDAAQAHRDVQLLEQELSRLPAAGSAAGAALGQLGQQLEASGQGAQKLADGLRGVPTAAAPAAPALDKLDKGLSDSANSAQQLDAGLRKLPASGSAAASSLSSLSAQLDPAQDKAQRLAAAQATLNNALAQGAITQERHSQLLNAATQRWGAHNEAVQQGGISAGQTAQAMRQLPAQLTDVVTSLSSGMPAWMVLIQQGGQIKDSFGGIGPALKQLASLLTVARVAALGTMAAVGAAALAYKQGSEEVDAYRKALVTTGNASGTTVGQLDQMAESIDKVVGTQGKAAEVLAQMAGSGRVAKENLQALSQAAIEAERDLGQSTDEAVKNFADLAKAPLAATLKFNESMHYLTASTYDQIKALEKQGRTEEAGEVAQKAYAAALQERSGQIKASLGTVEKGWRALTDAGKEAWDAMLGIGRQETLESKLAKAEERLKLAQEAAKGIYGGSVFGSGDADRVANAQANVDALKEQDQLARKSAEAQRQAAKAIEERAAAEKDNQKWADAGLTTQQKINKELVLYRANLEKVKAGGGVVTPQEQAKQEDEIRKSFGNGGDQVATATSATKLARVKADLSLLQDAIKTGDAIINKALDDGLVTLDAAYAARLTSLQNDTAAQRKAMEASIAANDAALARAKTAPEREGFIQKKVELQAQLKLLDSSLTEATRQLSIWKTEQEKQLSTITAKVRVDVAALTGKFDRGAVEAQLKAQYEGDYKATGRLPEADQAAARQRIDLLVQAGVEQAAFNAKLDEAQRLQSQLAVQEEAVRTQATQGVISQTEAEARINQLRRDQVPALRDVVGQLKAVRDAMPPDAAAAIERMDIAIAELENKAKSLTPVVVDLGTKMKNQFIDQFSDAVAQAAVGMGNLRSMVSSSLKQMAAEILKSGVKEALNYILKPSSPGSSSSGNLISTAISWGKTFFGFADGGHIRGPGTGTSDSIPALVDGRMPIAVSNNEYIQPDKAVRHYGLPFMEAIRTLALPKPRFAFGGLVQAHQQARYATGGQVTTAASAGAGQAPSVTLQFINNGTPQRMVQQDQQQVGKDLIVRVVLADLGTNGPISQGLRARGS